MLPSRSLCPSLFLQELSNRFEQDHKVPQMENPNSPNSFSPSSLHLSSLYAEVDIASEELRA